MCVRRKDKKTVKQTKKNEKRNKIMFVLCEITSFFVVFFSFFLFPKVIR